MYVGSFYQRLEALVMIFQEWSFLFLLALSENAHTVKKKWWVRLCVQKAMTEKPRKEILLPETSWAPICRILSLYTQVTILINERKSINPTILSIQIRNTYKFGQQSKSSETMNKPISNI